MADESQVELEKRLAENSAYFSALIELIPAKHYLPVDEEEQASKFYKNRQKKAPKQTIKEATRKAKRARLDPNQHKSIHEIQKETEENASNSSHGEQSEGVKQAKARFSVEKVESGNLDLLRSRLHARIQDFQRKRKAENGNREDQQHQRKKKTKKEVKQENQKMASVKDSKSFGKQDSKQSNRVVNESGEVVFSKFDFMEAKKAPRPGTKVKNYSKLLAKAEARKRKLETLEKEDVEKAKEFKEKHSWSQAIEKAEGIKQHDDPKLLKKAMKKREKEKTKSKKQWKERVDHQKKQADDKQKQRQKNIKERIEAKKGKKAGKGKKKHRPGF